MDFQTYAFINKSIACPLIILILGMISPKAVANPELDHNASSSFLTFEDIQVETMEFPLSTEKTIVSWSEIFRSPAGASPEFQLMTEVQENYSEQRTSSQTNLVPLKFQPFEPTEFLGQNGIREEETPKKSPDSTPLRFFSGTGLNAWQLEKGLVVVNFYNRLFGLSGTDRGGTGAHPDFGFSWGITNDLELTVEYQQVDSGSPGNQGDFDATRKTDSANIDGTVEIKQRIWQNTSGTQALGGVVSISWGDRGFNFTREGRTVFKSNSDPVAALEFPFSALVNNRWEFTIAPTIAFFPSQSALYWHVLPIDDPEDFGTTFGFTGSIAYHFNYRLKLWGDLFVPVSGNNSIIRSSGEPAKSVAYNAGIRYLVNPRAGVDVFVSNTLGSQGPLSLTADRDLTALGTGFFFMPDFISGNRRYPDSFKKEFEGATTPLTIYGLGLFERETLNSNQFLFNFLGGGQGIFTSFNYGLVKDAEVGIFLDYVFGTTDESLQGLSGKLRLFNQAEGDPLTVSVGGTVGQTNSPFVNYFFNDANAFEERNLDKDVPFIANTDDTETGQLFIVTVSFPLHYKFNLQSESAVWLTPIWGYVQRMGTELAGFNLGGLLPLFSDISLTGEVGVNFIKPGNAFEGNSRERVIPWTLALQWDPSNLLGLKSVENRPKIHFYVTNRVGFSPWLYMRVQEQNSTSVGAGFSIPF